MKTVQSENKIELQGWVSGEPVKSHENHGIAFYTLPLTIPRLSGTEDVLNLVVTEPMLQYVSPKLKDWLHINGEIRSFNNSTGVGSRLVITVFVQEMEIVSSEEPINHVVLSGVICKKPNLRSTPLGRKICDLLLAVNRSRYRKSDYLPCISWESVAETCSKMDVGAPLSIDGRLQSRVYRKVIDGKEIQRIAYEVSIMSLVESEDQTKSEEVPSE